MAGYDWVYGRRGAAGDRGHDRHPGSTRFGSRYGYDAPMRRYDAQMDHGWGAHYGESYIENYGSYGIDPGGGSGWRESDIRDPRYGTGWGSRPQEDRGSGRWGWEMIRGRYGGDFGPGSPREPFGDYPGRGGGEQYRGRGGGRPEFGGRYDRWRHGWHRGG